MSYDDHDIFIVEGHRGQILHKLFLVYVTSIFVQILNILTEVTPTLAYFSTKKSFIGLALGSTKKKIMKKSGQGLDYKTFTVVINTVGQ